MLRYFAFLDWYPNFKGKIGIAKQLDEYMDAQNKNKKFKEQTKKVMEKEFYKMTDFVDKSLRYGFSKQGVHQVSRVYFETISVGITLALRENPNINPKNCNLINIVKTEEFKKMISSKYHTHTPDIIIQRIDYVKNYLLGNINMVFNETRNILKKRDDELNIMFANLSNLRGSVEYSVIRKSSIIMMIYNMVEGVFSALLQEVFDYAVQNYHTIEQYPQNFLIIIVNYHIKRINGNAKKLLNFRNDNITTPQYSECRKYIEFYSGNLDVKKIREVANKFGADKIIEKNLMFSLRLLKISEIV